MNQELIDIFLVNYEMVFKEHFEEILNEYLFIPATEENFKKLQKNINAKYISMFPDKWEIKLKGETYVLDYFDVNYKSFAGVVDFTPIFVKI